MVDLQSSKISRTPSEKNELEKFFFKDLTKEEILKKVRKLIVFQSETLAAPVKLSHSIDKYFIELEENPKELYLTLPREPPVLEENLQKQNIDLEKPYGMREENVNSR